ncbi:MAG TPA: HTTM domain-containing protein [Pirellulales bacterium]|nr:HTTM domain-containing protein [Pirellulales bacterium]
MSLVREYLRELGQSALSGWNRFWFTPADPATLGLIRILAGAMLLYTHLVWSLALSDFFGAHSWVSAEAANMVMTPPAGPAEVRPAAPTSPTNFAWSYFWLIDSPTALCVVHVAGLVIFALFTLGLASRAMSVLAFLVMVSYVNRVPGALFGLDQINGMLAMYLMIGPSGAAYSLDRLRTPRRADGARPPAPPSTSANIAIRLIQVHLCVIYFFAALGKLGGESWWQGDALWGSFANLEYQSFDMTWMAGWPLAMALLTAATVYWELFFCVLVWPRLTRPLMLALAVPVHLGIALCMGMITFGLVMLIGCVSFVSPALVRRLLDRPRAGGAGQGRGAREAPKPSVRPRRGAAAPSERQP